MIERSCVITCRTPPHERYPGEVVPPPARMSSAEWSGGTFRSGQRSWTEMVEGTLRSERPILLATLHGGAERHLFKTEDGLAYDGPDRIGSVSYLPAGCERRLMLRSVAWTWASLSFADEGLTAGIAGVPSFCTSTDPLLQVVLAELARLQGSDGGLDETYCQAVSAMLAAHLVRRYGGASSQPSRADGLRLTAAQLRRIDGHVEAHLGETIRIADLAGLLDLSEGHLHRAYKATRGETPLVLINRRRIAAAARLLLSTEQPILSVALEVGFTNASAFARTFRVQMGCGPAAYRKRAAP